MKRAFTFGKLALLSAALLGAPGAAFAQFGAAGGITKNSDRMNELMAKVVEKAKPSVVKVKSDGKLAALGTVVQSDGYILTKASELRSDILYCDLPDGRSMPAKIVARHEAFDLALLKIELEDLTPVEWTLSHSAPVGSWVAAVGSDKKPAAIGVVSVPSRAMAAISKDDLIRTAPSNSGVMGVLLDEDDKGVYIQDFSSTSAAAKRAGLLVKDYFIAINGKAIAGREDLQKTIQKYKAGETVTVIVKRGTENKEFKVTLGKRDATIDRSAFQNSMGSELSDRRIGFPTILQHDSVIKPSDCGAPLVDLEGRVLGINIARGGRTESYAIPSEALLPLLPDLLAGKSTELKLLPSLFSVGSATEEVKAIADELKKAESDQKEAQRKLDNLKQRMTRAEDRLKRDRMAKLEELPAPKEVGSKK